MPDRPSFPIPAIINPPRKCLCIEIPWTDDHKQVLAGLFWELTQWFNWQRDDSQSGRQLAAVYRDVFLSIDWSDMSCCCNQTIPVKTRINPDDPAHMQISYDGGITWTDDPNNPDQSGVYYPPPVTSGVSATKCDAASNGLQHIKDFVDKVSALIAVGGDVWTVLGDVVLFIVALFTCGVAAIPVIVPVLIGVFSLVLALTGTVWADYFTSDVYDIILCALFCNISEDGSFTDDQANAVFTKLDTDLPAGIQKTFLMLVLRNQGTRGLNAICAYGSSADADCSSCECACGDLVYHVHQGTFVSQSVDEDGNCVIVVDSEFTGSHDDVDIFWNGTDSPVIGQSAVVKAYTVTGDTSVSTYAYLYFNNVLVGNNVPPDYCCNGYLWESNGAGGGHSFRVTVTVAKSPTACL